MSLNITPASCLVPDGCPDPDTGMPCNTCWEQRPTCGVCGQRFEGSHVEHYQAAHR